MSSLSHIISQINIPPTKTPQQISRQINCRTHIKGCIILSPCRWTSKPVCERDQTPRTPHSGAFHYTEYPEQVNPQGHDADHWWSRAGARGWGGDRECLVSRTGFPLGCTTPGTYWMLLAAWLLNSSFCCVNFNSLKNLSNPRTWVAEGKGSRVQGQPDLHSKVPSQTKQNNHLWVLFFVLGRGHSGEKQDRYVSRP